MANGSWEASAQAEAWRRAGLFGANFYISVNLSARQLQDPGLIDDVTLVLEDSGLPPTALVLEVTESTVMENFDTALARLGALKDLGLRLAVDDFGTGHSSLSKLRNLPVDVLKIDKSFIDRINQDAAGAAMVRSVIQLGHALGLISIAEGVEEYAQLTALDELECDHIQGYLYAKPMPATEIPAAISHLGHRAVPVSRGGDEMALSVSRHLLGSWTTTAFRTPPGGAWSWEAQNRAGATRHRCRSPFVWSAGREGGSMP